MRPHIHQAAHQASLSITNFRSYSTESEMSPDHLILCRPHLLPSIFPSIRVFSNESALRIRWPKCWSFSFSISPSNEHPGLVSFRMDWLDLLAVQGTLRSLLQHHSSKASILWCSTLTSIHDYWKNHSFEYMDFCPETPGKPKNNGVGSLFILWGILLTQESNLVSCITDGYFSS